MMEDDPITLFIDNLVRIKSNKVVHKNQLKLAISGKYRNEYIIL